MHITRWAVAIALGGSLLGCEAKDYIVEIEVLYSDKVTGGDEEFEVIADETRLREKLGELATELVAESRGAADGEPWYPFVDFNESVVVFVRVPFSCSARLQSFSANSAAPGRITLVVESGTDTCMGVDVECSGYALVKLPLLDREYVPDFRDISTVCSG